MSLTIAYDCIGANAAKLREQFPRARVCTYATATEPGIVWTPAEEALFPEKIRIATRPGAHMEQARKARELDIETQDATDEDAVPFSLARLQVCRDMRIKPDGLLYRQASGVPDLIPLILHLLESGFVKLHVAWWWEQGEPESVQPLLDELMRLGAEVDFRWIALWQYAAPGAGLPDDAYYDESVVLQRIDWAG